MVARQPNYSALSGTSSYVPGDAFVAGVEAGTPKSIDLGTPKECLPGPLAALPPCDCKYGRTIVVAAGAPPPAPPEGQAAEQPTGYVEPEPEPAAEGAEATALPAVIVKGADYLGQAMAEGMDAAGETKKAFFTVSGVDGVDDPQANWGATLGLPYKGEIVAAREDGEEIDDRVLALPDPDDPAELTSGDPRGTYTPKALGKRTLVSLVPEEPLYGVPQAGVPEEEVV